MPERLAGLSGERTATYFSGDKVTRLTSLESKVQRPVCVPLAVGGDDVSQKKLKRWKIVKFQVSYAQWR